MTLGQPSCPLALSFDLLIHNGWESPGTLSVIAYLMLQSYNLSAVAYNLLQSIQVVCLPALHDSVSSVWLLLYLWIICSQKYASDSATYYLGVQIPHVVACLAAPESMCSSCVPHFHLPVVGAIAVS